MSTKAQKSTKHPEPDLPTTADVLDTAIGLCTGERAVTHGGKQEGFDLIAAYWSVYLQQVITGKDVAQMMVLLKLSRDAVGVYNPDDFVDQAGYTGIAGELAALEHHDMDRPG